MRANYSDKEVINMIRSGDVKQETEAIRFLIRKNHQKVKNYVCGNSGSEWEAEEVMNDAIVALCQNMRKDTFKLNDNTKLGSYLYRIVMNNWLKRLRQQSNSSALRFTDLSTSEDNLAHPVSDTDELDTDCLSRALNGLSDKQKGIIIAYSNGDSMSTIADTFGLGNQENAKAHKYLIIKKLRELIQSYGC